MRPRGLSSSSPSSTKVGQVAVQKPQCTHLRMMDSEEAMSGSASWAGEKLVCIVCVVQACRVEVYPATCATRRSTSSQPSLRISRNVIELRSKGGAWRDARA